MKLKGLNAIVTGGTQGLGRRIVETFLREGASVTYCARNHDDIAVSTKELAALGFDAFQALPLDISIPAAAAQLVSLAESTFGEVGVLVNNAGIYGPIGATEDVSAEEWIACQEINLHAPLRLCQAVIPLMKARGGGKILFISGGGATHPMPRFTAYAASKAGLVRLAESLAAELADFGIDVNSVAPGALNTRLVAQVLAAGPDKAGEAMYEKNKAWNENGAVSPQRGADLCVFLASPASDGITGRLISAQWDPWENFSELKEELMASDIYTLRRIVAEDRGKAWSR